MGTVYEKGSPVGAGYNVRLTPLISRMNSSENYGESQTETTDQNGNYSFNVSFSGNYILEGLTPDNSTLIDSQQCYLAPGTVLTVNLGEIPSPLPTPSADEVTIRGVVYDSGGKTAGSGYPVRLTLLLEGSEAASSENYGEVQDDTTDGNSEFTFTVTYTGGYLLEVWTPDGSKLLGTVEFSVLSSSFGSILNISVKIIKPILTGVTDGNGADRDPDNNVTAVTFTLTGSDFSADQGTVAFIKQSDSSESAAAVTSWTNTEVRGTVNIGEGKYLVRVTAYGLSSSEDIYYRKGLSWHNVGSPEFSAGSALYTSLYIYNRVPYVAYTDIENKRRTTVMKYAGGDWQNVGNPGFSAGVADYTSLYVYNGVPYVAYSDNGNGGRATVMKYDYLP